MARYKYEYTTLVINQGFTGLDDKLNEYGQKGWRLVSLKILEGNLIYTFIRGEL